MSNDSNQYKKFLSGVKLPKDISKNVYTAMLDTFKLDNYTKRVIKAKIIDTGKEKYVGLIKKYPEFLTPIRLMILVDFVDVDKAFRYYLNDYNNDSYDKNISKDYNLVSGLHSVELKLVMLEHIFDMFQNSTEINIVFHQPQEKVDAFIESSCVININLINNEGHEYENKLECGKYAFESRCCSSITDASYILNNENRKKHINKFDKYFLFVPRDTNIFDDIIAELEKNKIKIIFSEYGTIDLVNDVSYMEGILTRKE